MRIEGFSYYESKLKDMESVKAQQRVVGVLEQKKRIRQVLEKRYGICQEIISKKEQRVVLLLAILNSILALDISI